MKSKSKVSVLSLSLEDPASNAGMIRISEKLVPFVPSYPSGRKQKTVVFGDQGYVERGDISFICFDTYIHMSGHGVSWGRCGEKEPEKRLEGLVFMPQEWHKKKVGLSNIFGGEHNISSGISNSGWVRTLQCVRGI